MFVYVIEFLQFGIQVKDLGSPEKTASNPATIVVRVIRNKNAPTLSNLPSISSLNQTSAVGSRVFNVEAREADQEPPFNTLK